MLTILITKDEILDKDEVLKMARQAGYHSGIAMHDIELLEAFAKLVDAKATAREREACAKVCDELSKKHSWEGCYANECAEAIRARGTHE
jgi:hypothetical protein